MICFKKLRGGQASPPFSEIWIRIAMQNTTLRAGDSDHTWMWLVETLSGDRSCGAAWAETIVEPQIKLLRPMLTRWSPSSKASWIGLADVSWWYYSYFVFYLLCHHLLMPHCRVLTMGRNWTQFSSTSHSGGGILQVAKKAAAATDRAACTQCVFEEKKTVRLILHTVKNLIKVLELSETLLYRK